jgi:hypothetical protein
MVDDPDRMQGVEALGVDKIAFLAADGRHHIEFITGMVDVTAARRLNVVRGRSGAVLSSGLRHNRRRGDRARR